VSEKETYRDMVKLSSFNTHTHTPAERGSKAIEDHNRNLVGYRESVKELPTTP